MNRNRFTLALIFLIVVVALIIDWPRVPVKFNLGPIKVDTVLAGPKLDLDAFGLSLKRDLDVKLGLDLQGGTDLTLRADMSDIPDDKK
jgi:preprotein translocase subunit SecD